MVKLQGAESRKDFIHKLGICLKEIREIRRWLRLIAPSAASLRQRRSIRFFVETEELIRIFAASIRTAEKNARMNVPRSSSVER